MPNCNKNKSFNYQSYILVLLWISGFVKNYINTYIGTFDLVLFMVVLACIDILYQSTIRKLKISTSSFHILISILLFYSYILISLLYSPSYLYKYEKATSFIINIIFFIYPLFINQINLKLLARLYAILLIPIALFSIYMSSIVWSVESNAVTKFIDLKYNYLGLGIHLGILFLILNHLKTSIFIQLFVFLLLIASAGRGPLLFIIVIVFIKYLSSNKSFKLKSLLRLFLTIIISFIVLIIFKEHLLLLFERSFGRLSSLISYGNDNSSNERIQYMQFAFYQPFYSLQSLLIGNGFGSFGIIFSGNDVRAYPHNIFLEVFFELGIVGLIIISVLLFLTLSKLSLKDLFSILFLFCFFNSLKSSSIIDLWLLFSFIGLIARHKHIINTR